MEDALFNTVLFAGFFCLYSAMFAPKKPQAPVSATAVQQAAATEPAATTAQTQTVTPVVPVVTEPVAVAAPTLASVTALAESEHNDLEPDRNPIAIALTASLEPDREPLPIASPTAVGFTAIPGNARQRTAGLGRNKSRTDKEKATASGKGSESRH